MFMDRISIDSTLRTVEWKNNKVIMIEQTKLPNELIFVEYDDFNQVANAIKTLIVRGAPAIGVSGAFGLGLAVLQSKATTKDELLSDLEDARKILFATRPTAVNLGWGLEKIMNVAKTGETVEQIRELVISTAKKMADEDIEINKSMGKNGSVLFDDNDTIMTHCNAGALATVAYGTALGVIRATRESGKNVKVIATETRPIQQGSRLTAFELKHDGFDVSLVPDTAVGYSMANGLVNKVVVGADRIVKTGHVFNKIGTYQVATMAKQHGIPFYVAAPLSTIDMKKIVKLIDKVKDNGAAEIEAKVKTFTILLNEVERLNVGLESAPKEGESGPLFSKLRESERELAEKRAAVEILEQKITQDRSLIVISNQKIRKALHGEIDERKSSTMQKMGNEVQEVLDIYAENLRSSKIKILENEILESLNTLLHKENFVEKVSIDKETFEVKLFKGDDDEITKDMLSKGELQMYATAIVWGLAKTSGRPLPFIIDTPLARLDEEHRSSLVQEFYPERHQTIILSTDSEINYEYYKKLEPYISNSYVIQYDSGEGKTVIQNGYFFNSKGEKIEV